MTRTKTTYCKTNMAGDQPTTPRGPNCLSHQLARDCDVQGDSLAIIEIEWRLGNDGAWHETQTTIVERILSTTGMAVR